jgi:hypothetical protein
VGFSGLAGGFGFLEDGLKVLHEGLVERFDPFVRVTLLAEHLFNSHTGGFS